MKNLYYLFILSFLLISCEEEVPTRYKLTIQISPQDGGNVFPSSGEYNSGDQVSVKATASSNYNFLKWGGNGNGDSSNPIPVTVNSDITLIAEFELIDADKDGVTDALDICADTPIGQPVDDNGCSTSQKDTDKDGLNDDIDLCPNTPDGEDVDENGCSISQRDTDKDGVKDDKDLCPDTPEGEDIDEKGCSNSQRDDDSDGVINALDQCPETPENTDVDDSGCSYVYLDENGVTLKSTQSGEFMYKGDLYRSHLGSLKDIVKSEFFRKHGASKLITTFATDMTSAFRYYHDYGYEPKQEFIPELFNDDISSWDVSNVVSMERMFHGCETFNQDLSYWDVSNVTNMRGMFHGADKS